MNLLIETKDAIKRSGHNIRQIVFIGSLKTGHSCTWNEFKKLADRDYDNGFGGQEVASDLVIAFSDKTYMTRGEYDGSEWWQYNEPLVIPKQTKPIKSLFGDSSWLTLTEIDDEILKFH